MVLFTGIFATNWSIKQIQILEEKHYISTTYKCVAKNGVIQQLLWQWKLLRLTTTTITLCEINVGFQQKCCNFDNFKIE